MKYYGSSLLCQSEMTVRHYFSLASDGNIADYSFSYTDANGNVISLNPQYASDKSLYFVDISGIMAYNLDKKFECNVTNDGTNILKLAYGPFSYAYIVANKSTDEKLKTLTNALYSYWSSGNKLFDNNTHN